eukprot:TRINITY_DN8990_c3_g1_i2.p1 TRINITY_DN8990_c3_g1~~TRINITY_DN8990_c3_g1_i2.p1  ORF type:complete len:276 (+),score=75.55 TRINITY_DN8990_c3_g1_i2:25-828(+)
MSMIKRRRRGDDDQEDPEGPKEENNEENEEFEVDINFNDIKESDFHGIKALLKDFVGSKTDFPISDLADAVVNQVSVGTVMKSDEEAPIGVITLFNIFDHKERPFWQEFQKLIPMEEIIEQFGDEKDLGVLINERFINCPPEVGPFAIQNLNDDLDWAVKNEETQEKKDSFKIKGVIYPTFIVKHPIQKGGSVQNQDGKTKKNRRKKSGDGQEDLVFLKPEDQWLYGVSEGKREIGGGAEGLSLLVMWFDAVHLKEAQAGTKALLEE